MSHLHDILASHFQNTSLNKERESLSNIHESVFRMVVAILHNRFPPYDSFHLFTQGYHQIFIMELFGPPTSNGMFSLSALRNPATLPIFEEVIRRWRCAMDALPAPPLPLLTKLGLQQGSAWQLSSTFPIIVTQVIHLGSSIPSITVGIQSTEHQTTLFIVTFSPAGFGSIS
jgi:hypothetical protein